MSFKTAILLGGTLALLLGCFFENIGPGSTDPDPTSQVVIQHDRAIAKEILDSNGISLPNNGIRQDAEGAIKSFVVINQGLKSFTFPPVVKKFQVINVVLFNNNELTELPKGIDQRKWAAIWLSGNKICNPTNETIAYLDQMVDGYKLGRDWRETQICE